MNLKSVVFLVLTAMPSLLLAQGADSSAASVRGTYQLQVIGSRAQPLVPENLAVLVQKNRHAREVVYIALGTQLRLKVLPYSEIGKAGFKPVQPVAHLTSEQAAQDKSTSTTTK
jgi:hypothetical protein